MNDEYQAAFLLLRAAAAAGGELAFDSAVEVVGGSAASLRRVVAGLPGQLVPAQATSMRPRYRLTDIGRERLRQELQREPVEYLRLHLWTESGSDPTALCAGLYVSDQRVAAAKSVRDSYKLSAIRFLLSFAPDAISSGAAHAAAYEIGRALLPRCPECVYEPANRSCSRDTCVYGAILGRLRQAEAAGGRIEVSLLEEPPWNHVPWEMAMLHGQTFLTLQNCSLVRAVDRVAHGRRVLDGDIGVVLAIPEVGDPQERRQLVAEAKELAAVLSQSSSPERTFLAQIVASFSSGEELRSALRRHRPRIVHLVGHGAPSGVLVGEKAVPNREMASTLAEDGVEFVVLGACFGATETGTSAEGASLARRVAEHGVAGVVAFEGRAEAAHAHRFALAMYRELAVSGSVDQSVRVGRASMQAGTPYFQWGQVVLFAGSGL